MNLLSTIRPDQMGPFSWENPPDRWEVLPGDGLRVYAPAGSDYFLNPDGSAPVLSAPYLYLMVEGDFVAQAHVRHAFQSMYDAGCLLVRHDDAHWAKLCYEGTDLGTQAVVSVVTNGISDDANGVDLTTPDVWLQIVRAGDCFAMHYALDGHSWRMTRYFRLPLPPAVKVGLLAQCPTGAGSVIDWPYFGLERRTVANLRAGR